MTIFTGVILYLLIWWTALFVVLPWGVQRDVTVPTGAPVNPRLRHKFIATTLLSCLIWMFIFGLVQLQIIDFRAIALQMVVEDHRS